MAKKNQAALGEQGRPAKKRGVPMGAKVALALGAAGVMSIFGGCDNSTNPAPQSEPKVDVKDDCACPAGTTHKPGEKCCDGENCACAEEQPQPKVCNCAPGTFHDEGTACCDGENCECKEAYNVSLGTKQIRVEDTTGQANRTEIQKALTYVHANLGGSSDVVHFENMSSNPIMVIESTHNFRVDGNKFFIGIDKLEGDGSDTNSKILNNIYLAISDIYNVMGTPLMSKVSNKEINGLGIQFDAMKNIIYISRAAIQHQRQRLQA
ncbi:MAG: hypothetical protein LBK83_16555 [Treponema sp.]|nr:hypothetical protein [Treponema sp.]